MWGECISGALYINDFHSLAKAAGFEQPVVLQKSPIAINDSRMRALLGNAQVFSITYRLFKLPGLLEPQSEDYGQIATYKVLISLLICISCVDCAYRRCCCPAAHTSLLHTSAVLRGREDSAKVSFLCKACNLLKLTP